MSHSNKDALFALSTSIQQNFPVKSIQNYIAECILYLSNEMESIEKEWKENTILNFSEIESLCMSILNHSSFVFPLSYSSSSMIQYLIRSNYKQCTTNTNTNTNNQFIDTLKQSFYPIFEIKTKSCYGHAFIVHYKNSKKPLCCIKVANEIKVESSQKNQAELLHEICIGLTINSIRNTYNIPYFCFMYGACIEVDNTNKNTRVISFQEYCPSSISLPSLLLRSSLVHIDKLIKDIFYQLAYALFIAQTHFKFMHFDCHGDNVLLCKWSTPRTISLQFSADICIQLEQVEYYPVLIDFGSSCLSYDSTSLLNKYKAVYPMQSETESETIEIKEKSLLFSGGSESTFFHPLFDLYRYITYCFVYCISSSNKGLNDKIAYHKKVWCSYFDQYIVSKNHTNTTNHTNFKDIYSMQEDIKQWKKEYIKYKQAYPKIKHKELFSFGTIPEWIKHTNEFYLITKK